VYKAASEGIMNLADKFFEMERAQALQVGVQGRLAALCARQACGIVYGVGLGVEGVWTCVLRVGVSDPPPQPMHTPRFWLRCT
jgi:hypothetical protein